VTAALALAALTCWFCRPLVVPRWRFGADDVRYHLRLLGGQRRLTVLALVLTVAACATLLATPSGEDADPGALRWADASCGKQESPYDPPTCYALEPGGRWVVEEVRPDRIRVVIATVATPAFR
jgi:hypothetical protein